MRKGKAKKSLVDMLLGGVDVSDIALDAVLDRRCSVSDVVALGAMLCDDNDGKLTRTTLDGLRAIIRGGDEPV